MWELVEGEEFVVVKNFGSERELKFFVGVGNGVYDGKGRVNSVFWSRLVNVEGEVNGNEEGRRSGIFCSRLIMLVLDVMFE